MSVLPNYFCIARQHNVMLELLIVIILALCWNGSSWHGSVAHSRGREAIYHPTHCFQYYQQHRRFTLHAKTSSSSKDEGGTEHHWDPKAYPKLNFEEDFYSVLEVQPTCTPEELKRSYNKLAFKYHPDRKRTEEEKDLANKQMMVINGAYRVLRDPKKRAEYDKKRMTKAASTFSKTSSTTTWNMGKNSWFSGYSPTNMRDRTDVEVDVDADISFEEFRAMAEEMYGNVYTSDPAALRSMFERAKQVYKEEYTHRPSSSSSRRSTEDTETLRLRNELNELKRKRDNLEAKLRADKRDWGVVSDKQAIKDRLAALDEVRNLGYLIEEMEARIRRQEGHSRSRKQEDDRQSYQRSGRKTGYDEFDDRSEDDWMRRQRAREYARDPHARWWEREPEPRPQPQPQRSRDSNGRYRTIVTTDDQDYGPLWRDAQERRRRGLDPRNGACSDYEL